jgi:hypothetical protein
MDTKESLRQTLEHFLQQKQKKVDEIRGLDLAIRQIRMELGEDVDEEDAGLALSDMEHRDTPLPLKRTGLDVRPDQYFGMSQGDAAKAYLKMRGQAVSIDELVKALTSGGCKVGGADPKRTLYISLVRNVREFVPPQPGFIGLRDFYPNLKGKPKK